jgi:hypothetical protein
MTPFSTAPPGDTVDTVDTMENCARKIRKSTAFEAITVSPFRGNAVDIWGSSAMPKT